MTTVLRSEKDRAGVESPATDSVWQLRDIAAGYLLEAEDLRDAAREATGPDDVLANLERRLYALELREEADLFNFGADYIVGLRSRSEAS